MRGVMDVVDHFLTGGTQGFVVAESAVSADRQCLADCLMRMDCFAVKILGETCQLLSEHDTEGNPVPVLSTYVKSRLILGWVEKEDLMQCL